MKKTAFFIAVAFCFCVAGCTTAGHYVEGKDFDASKRDHIVKDISTKEDVLKLYGDPMDKGIDEKYNEFWVYLYSESNNEYNIITSSSKGNKRIKKLIIVFGKNNTVENFVYSDSTNPMKYDFKG